MRYPIAAARRLVVLGLVVLSLPIACSPSTAPVREPVEFTAALVGFRWIDPPIPPTVQVSSHRVEVKGVLSTPNPCYDLAASATRAARIIFLTVTASSRSAGCVAAIGTFDYTAVLDVSPGRYTLRVDYVYVNTGWPDKQVFSSDVTVP